MVFARPEKVDASLDGPPVVAVLPFVNVSGDEASEGLALGFKKAFFTGLAGFPEFQIVLRPSGYAYQDDPAVDMAVDLRVGAPRGRPGAGHRRSSWSARTGKLLWSERWDRAADDVFALETEVAEQISNRLGGDTGLIVETGRDLARRKPPDERTAYELYLLGTEKLAGFNRADVEEAIGLLDRAVELEPGLARAWVELSVAHDLMADFGIEPESHRRAAADAAARAVELDPRDPRRTSSSARACGCGAISCAPGRSSTRRCSWPRMPPRP